MKQQPCVQNRNFILKIFTRKSIAISFIGIAMLLFSCKSDMKKVKEFAELKNQPTIIAEDFETIYSDSAKITYKLISKQLFYYEDTDPAYFEYPKGVHIEKYDRNMKITASIRSDYAKMYVKDKQWEAKNNVVAINAAGDTLKTEKLLWDEKKGKIYSDVFVKIIREDQIITGIGLEASQDFSNWEIDNPKGTLYLEMEEQQ